MRKEAKIREVLRIHREEHASRQSARPASPAVSSLNSISPHPADSVHFTTVVQAPSPLVPVMKEPLLQGGNATFSSSPQPVPKSTSKKRKRAILATPIIPGNGKDDIERDPSWHTFSTSSISDMSDGGGVVEDSEDEREKQVLWAAFSTRYAELVESQTKQSSIETPSSADREKVAAPTVLKSFTVTEKPIEETTASKGSLADPIEIDSN